MFARSLDSRAWILVILLAWMPGMTSIAGAQDAPRGVIPLMRDPEVRIDLDSFGVGDVARRGDWTGVRLKLLYAGDAPKTVLVRLAHNDPDGDEPEQQISLALNPGTPQSVWLYTRLPFRYTPGEGLVASVMEALEGGQAPDGSPGYRPGRLLGRVMLNPGANAVEEGVVGIVGIVGDRMLGLQPYSDGDKSGIHIMGTEMWAFAKSIRPGDMPDHWSGLASLGTLLWANGEPAGSFEPSQLSLESARAVRQWVERGGHLVIILPQYGQTWTSEQSNKLYSIMPAVSITTEENADLLSLRPMLSLRNDSTFPSKGTVHYFRPQANAEAGQAIPVLAAPDGRCVVVRRLVGAGAVTLVGIDLNATAFSQFSAVQAEAFWHRVFGRRGPQSSASAKAGGVNFGRNNWIVDGDIDQLIAQTGRTYVGVLVGLIVFALYWLVAGPLGYAALKSRGMQRHSWVLFLGSGVVFTGVCWGGATVLRPSRVSAKHVTILDHVYGQPMERARMWASVLIPTYGTSRISVERPDPDSPRALISAWDPPGDESAWRAFPDARGYVVDTRDPSILAVPTRATVKQVQVDWAGGPRWGMPMPVGEGDAAKLELVTENNADRLKGVLVHHLPGALRDVRIVIVRGQRPYAAPGDGSRANDTTPIVQGSSYALAGEWPAETELDLAAHTGGDRPQDQAVRSLTTFLNSLVPRPESSVLAVGGQDPTRDLPWTTRMNALAFFGMLPQPDLGDNASVPFIPLRRVTHGYDLSRWLTQPCIIIVGELSGDAAAGASPVPLTVDGETVPTNGRTFVRWVYPLPANPPAYPESDNPASPGPVSPGLSKPE